MNQETSALDAEVTAKIHASFQLQQVMQLLNARLRSVKPGETSIEFPYQKALTQQNGYIHAGILSTVVDSACGYAALSLMPPACGVLSIEFKVNFLSPAIGEFFIATGKVVRAGRNITVCSGEVMAITPATHKVVAVMQATMMTVENRND